VKKPFNKKPAATIKQAANQNSNDSIDIPPFVDTQSEAEKKINNDLLQEMADRSKENIINQMLEDAAITNLSSAKANWYFGEWQALIEIDIQALSSHPDVAKITALKASGYQQLNEIEQSKTYFKLAKELGCDNQLISQLLIAGVHNTLGKVAALKKDDDKTLAHFDAAVNVGRNSQDNKLARQARAVKEISKLGLLPQAAKLLTSEKEAIDLLSSRPSYQQSQIKILTSEVEIINHELMLAYKKSQLYANTSEGISIYHIDGSINKEQLKRLSPSQLGQDLWVLEQANYKKGGFFVEFGATDGVLLSNSYLLEKEFGWGGICAEPNPEYFSQLKNNRDCISSPECITNKTGEKVRFILANEFGGIDGISTIGKHKEKVNAYKEQSKVITLDTITLGDFLEKHKAPIDIDYISIDTEGSEYSILSVFPFKKWNVKLFTVEHNFEAQRDEIKELMESNGYVRVEAQWDDWYYKK